MKFPPFAMASLLAVACSAAPAPTKSLDEQPTHICDQYASIPTASTGPYTLYNNLWGKDSGSGSQCTTLESLNGSSIAWTTSWSWTNNPDSVKSYANVVATNMTQRAIRDYHSLKTKWAWTYSGSNLVADVSYDMFTSSSATGAEEFEIMVWLAALGKAGPISSSGSTVGNVNVAGTTFDLYRGPNGNTIVYSFVARKQNTAFDGDLKHFFDYLVQNQTFPSSQVLLRIGAGTEPFTGDTAVLKTHTYSVEASF